MTDTAVTGAPREGSSDALPGGPSDADLITAVRGGDLDAYGVLFGRHVDSARRLARSLSTDGEADDLVSEAFAKVLDVLQRGDGPDTALRPYLLTALRRLHIDRVRSVARTRPTDDMAAYDAGEEFQDTAVAGFETGAAARAFKSLPERWQLVLWHLEVEEQKPADIAPLLGISANSVSALAYRAREGLRQAFVSMHAQDADDESCARVRAQLGAFIRNDISKRDGVAVEAHLRDCRECAGIYLELVEVNSDLRALIAPLVLGGATTAYLAGTGATVGGAGVLGTITGFLADNVAKSIAGAAAAGVAVAGVVVGVNVASGDESREAAPQPVASAPAGPGEMPGLTDRTKPTRDSRPTPSAEPTPDAVDTSAPTDSPATADPTDTADDTEPDPPRPTQPVDPTDPPEPTDPPTPTTPPDPATPDPSISSSARGTGGLAYVVDIRVADLPSGERGTVSVTLDRPAVAFHLDPRCDLISLGRLTCRLTGPGTITLVVTPIPGAATTLSAVLQPGDDRSTVRLG